MSNLDFNSQNHKPTYEHFANHKHAQFRCYLRTSDMKSKVQNISAQLSVTQLKQLIFNLFQFQSPISPASLKLIVNQTQLTNQMNLSLHLFQNAIIHILPIINPQQQNNIISSSSSTSPNLISIKIKQPPINCPISIIQDINIQQISVLEFKEKIIEFYRNSNNEKDSQTRSQLAGLNVNDLYLVFSGQILNNQKKLIEYGVGENGVVYVVNGNLYAREVTKEQAERRIQEVRNQHQKQNQTRQQASKQQQQQSVEDQTPQLDQHNSNIVFNIIQNIVHDQDSEVQGQVAQDLQRSQKIIHRYDSLNKDLDQLQQDHRQKMDPVNEQQQNNHDSNKQAQKNSVFEFLTNLGKKIVSTEEKVQEIVHTATQAAVVEDSEVIMEEQRVVQSVQTQQDESLLD